MIKAEDFTKLGLAYCAPLPTGSAGGCLHLWKKRDVFMSQSSTIELVSLCQGKRIDRGSIGNIHWHSSSQSITRYPLPMNDLIFSNITHIAENDEDMQIAIGSNILCYGVGTLCEECQKLACSMLIEHEGE